VIVIRKTKAKALNAKDAKVEREGREGKQFESDGRGVVQGAELQRK